MCLVHHTQRHLRGLHWYHMVVVIVELETEDEVIFEAVLVMAKPLEVEEDLKYVIIAESKVILKISALCLSLSISVSSRGLLIEYRESHSVVMSDKEFAKLTRPSGPNNLLNLQGQT